MIKWFVILATTMLVACANTTGTNAIPIVVVGEGVDFNSAKNNAFHKAIEQEIGVVLLSKREVNKNQLRIDEIHLHSAGIVSDFKIDHHEVINGRHLVTVRVWVSSSKLAERVLTGQQKTHLIDGNKIFDQSQSYHLERMSGDNLLQQVVNDFPSKAFIVNNLGSSLRIDPSRNVVLQINYKVSWNYNYLQALNETLKHTSEVRRSGYTQDRITVISKNPKNIIGSTDTYYFNDTIRSNIVKNKMLGPIFVEAKVYDSDDNIIYKGCSVPYGFLPYHVVEPFFIDGNQIVNDSIFIKIGNSNVKKIHRVDLTHRKNPC